MFEVRLQTAEVARRDGRNTYVTLAERGIVGSLPDGTTVHVPALPLRGEIDIVGADDSVTANLTAATAARATLGEALQLASAAKVKGNATLPAHRIDLTRRFTRRAPVVVSCSHCG